MPKYCSNSVITNSRRRKWLISGNVVQASFVVFHKFLHVLPRPVHNLSPTNVGDKSFCRRPVNQNTQSGRLIGGWAWLTCATLAVIGGRQSKMSAYYSTRCRRQMSLIFVGNCEQAVMRLQTPSLEIAALISPTRTLAAAFGTSCPQHPNFKCCAGLIVVAIVSVMPYSVANQ